MSLPHSARRALPLAVALSLAAHSGAALADAPPLGFSAGLGFAFLGETDDCHYCEPVAAGGLTIGAHTEVAGSVEASAALSAYHAYGESKVGAATVGIGVRRGRVVGSALAGWTLIQMHNGDGGEGSASTLVLGAEARVRVADHGAMSTELIARVAHTFAFGGAPLYVIGYEVAW